MGGSEKRKSAGKKAGKSEPTVHANSASKNSSSSQATETAIKVASSDLIADNLHDYLKQGNDPDEFMLVEEEFPCLPVSRQPPNNAELWIKIQRSSSRRSRTFLGLCRIDRTR